MTFFQILCDLCIRGRGNDDMALYEFTLLYQIQFNLIMSVVNVLLCGKSSVGSILLIQFLICNRIHGLNP